MKKKFTLIPFRTKKHHFDSLRSILRPQVCAQNSILYMEMGMNWNSIFRGDDVQCCTVDWQMMGPAEKAQANGE